MERLEPILKQKFWILLGVAILMTLVGWWMSTAALATTIAARKSSIEGSFKKVPTGTIPNEDWTKKLTAINDEQERAISRTQAELWKRQLAKMMTWPEGVDLKNGYWGLLNNFSMETLRLAYREEIERVWRELNPLDYTGKGIVQFPMDNMYKIVRQEPWNRIGEVTSEQAWEIKEDLWLLERLFQSIDSVNGGPDVTRNDAAIHVISDLQLRGGGPKAAAGEAAGAPSGMAGMSLSGEEKDFMRSSRMGPGVGMGRPGMGGSGTGGMAENLVPVSAEFDPSEEFGDDGSYGSTFASAVPGGAMGGGMGRGMFGGGGSGGRHGDEDGGPGMGMGMGMGGGGAGGGGGKQLVRYISKEDGKPSKTRGFYLSVIMDHTKIPDLIAELTSCEGSDLPVEVIRVQMARLHEDEISAQSSTRPLAGMGGGRPGMGIGRPGRAGGDEDEGPRGIGRMVGGARGGGINPFAGRAMTGMPGQPGLGQFGQTGNTAGPINPAFEAAYATAEASLTKALADPVMAQVTICGIFTLYQKMPEPAEETPAASPTDAAPGEPASDEATPGEPTSGDPASATTEDPAANADGQPADSTSADPSAAEGTETDAPMEPENENSDAPATKPDAIKVEEEK